eukprot:Clim_evm1s22 gene=Clim_evmTU1s22
MSPIAAISSTPNTSFVRVCNWTGKEDWHVSVPEDTVKYFQSGVFNNGNQVTVEDGKCGFLYLAATEDECDKIASLPVTINAVNVIDISGVDFNVNFEWSTKYGICMPSFQGTDKSSYQPANYATAMTRLMLDDEHDNSYSVILSVCPPEQFKDRVTTTKFGASCPDTKAENIIWYSYP